MIRRCKDRDIFWKGKGKCYNYNKYNVEKCTTPQGVAIGLGKPLPLRGR